MVSNVVDVDKWRSSTAVRDGSALPMVRCSHWPTISGTLLLIRMSGPHDLITPASSDQAESGEDREMPRLTTRRETSPFVVVIV